MAGPVTDNTLSSRASAQRLRPALLARATAMLVGSETVEVRGRRATFVAPGNTVHGLRNIGTTDAVLCIAYPAVGVTITYVEGVAI